jgi:hypothetical protein
VIDAVGIADECVGEAAEIEQAKNEEFPLLFPSCCPVTPKSAHVIFFEEFRYKSLWNRHLLTISPVFLTHFCDSPLYFAPPIQQ